MRYRITVRGHAGSPIELRGYCDDPALIRKIANAVEPEGVMIVMSPADDNYNPFSLDDL